MKSVSVDQITSNESYVRMRIFDGEFPPDAAKDELVRIERAQHAETRRRLGVALTTLEAEKARADAATRERDALIKDVSAGDEDGSFWYREILKAQESLVAQRDEARAALQPFADCYSSFSPLEFDTSPVDIHGPLNLNVGDLRRARDAITQEPTP